MNENFKPEDAPPPAPLPTPQSKEYSGSVFFCFFIDEKVFNRDFFSIESSINTFSYEVNSFGNLVVVRVFSGGLIDYTFQIFSKTHNFKILYRNNNRNNNGEYLYYSKDYTADKKKTQFIYNAAKGNIVDLFRSPSCLEQYISFSKVIKEDEYLFYETLDYLSKSLDIELFLYLLEKKVDKRHDILDILNYLPYIKVVYEKDKRLGKIDFNSFPKNKNLTNLIIIYSIIQDSSDLVKGFNENDFDFLFKYNETQKDSPLYIRKNNFILLLDKIKNLDNIKKICRYCESIPLLFEYLLSVPSDKLQEIKNLSINDLPNINPKDNLIELIEKYETIKDIFKEREIIKLWKNYLSNLYSKKSIAELEQINEKLISIDNDFYLNLIAEINTEIITKGKRMIDCERFKSLEMLQFINKYNSKDNFYSDEQLLKSIGKNINLKELSENENILKEFNECRFFKKIQSSKIKGYIDGVLSQINDFDEFSLFFKYIYILNKKGEDNIELEKNKNASNSIINHFISLLTKIFKIEKTEYFKDILQKIMLLSLIYIDDNIKKINYKEVIQELGKCSFSRDDLFNIFIEVIINPNFEQYIPNERKNEVCEEIIKTFYPGLNIEKKINFLLKIKSLVLKEKYIFKYFPEAKFDDLICEEDKELYNYMINFINKKVLENNELSNSSYFIKLQSFCNSIKEQLENRKINYKIVKLLNKLKSNKKLSERIKCICLGDLAKSSELEQKINEYSERYIRYHDKLQSLITYYNKYYPKSKKQDIDNYSQQQLDFNEAKKNICEIEINENIYDEIQKFERYGKSKFFGIFYKDTEFSIKNPENEEDSDSINEVKRFEMTILTFNECEKLFNGKELKLSFLEQPLNKLEDNENNEILSKEVLYLKNYFGYNDSDEKKITEELAFYKNKKNIFLGLKSLINIIKLLSVKFIDNFSLEISELIEEIEKLENFSDIPKIIKKLKNNDENILEKNFIEILNIFEKNNELLNFLISKKESEARDLIDGLFDNDNDENVTIELRDIEILINAVCFIQELKNKTDNINIFLKNFHSLLDENNDTYKEILINLLHIDSKLYQLQEYIKIQLGKKYKYTANIEKFLSEGIIEFKKLIRQPIDDILHKDTKKEKNPEFYYEAIIKIGDKEEKFQEFMQTIKKIKAKNIYKYGKNRDNFLKSQKIAQIVQGILRELNLNVKQEFNETYVVPNLEFINKDVLKLPQLEKVLNDLKKKNNQIKSENLKKLDNDPSLQYLLNYDLYDTEEIKNREKIENYFPNIQEIEDKNKIIHKNFHCEECRMSPIIGVRYNCKTCENFNYCENCIVKKGVEHGHEFNKIEIPIEYEGIPSYLLIFNIFTQLKEELNNLNGLYFYKSSKDDYELDILKINNKFLVKFPTIGDKIPSILTKNLPFFFNLLLCNDNLDEYEIHSFCVRAINCTTNNLFFIVRPEELNIGNEKYFFKTINKLLEKKNYKINSCIIILYINSNSHIIKQLKKIRDKYELPEEPSIFKTIEDSPIEDLKDLPIELVTSDSPRVGKTEYIYKQLEDDEVYFTITLGDIDNLFLLKNMYVLNELKNNKLSIIIELYENPDENTKNLIRNFLFQFIILKVYDKYTYIDKEIKVFIEISSDYTTYYEDFKILKLFKKYHIELKNNPNFYDTYKINPRSVENLLIVLNYLELLKNGEINNILPLANLLKTILDKKTPELFISDYDSLIKEYLIKKFPIKNLLPNYGQIKIFSDLLGHLLLNLDLCSQMEPKNIKENEKYFPSLVKIRERIVLSYIEFVIKFSSLTYESILENQEIAAKNQKIVGYKLSNELKSKLIEQLNKKKVISYNEIKPSIVLFNQIPQGDQYKDLNKCSILTTYKEGDKEYIELNQIYQDYLKQGELLSLSDFGAPQFKFELENICLTPNTEFIYINEKLLDYEFTMDNFVKMVLIYLRIKSNVPLILLGETGCGKTSLIQSLVYFLKGKYKLIIYNIHAGLKYNDIMDFLLKNNLLEFNPSNKSKDTEIMNVILKLLKINKDEKEEEKIILFLDEINTTNSLSLLSHLFTKRCFLGLPLKKNVYIIAACNPYRLMLSKNEDIGYRNKKMHKIRNLVYTVNPLPLCLINYVFDFGNLRDEDEEKYINKFVDSFMNSRFSKSNNFNYSNILEIICKAVYTSQKFIKKFSEISSVSLREIKRFRLFFEFFFNITKRRNEFSTPDISFNELKSMFVGGLSEEEIIENINILKAANLSIFICYYLRIINSKLREQLSEELTKVFKFDFLDYPLQLENELADNINLEKGIAKNRALLDNLFALFVCLNNKVPVFICGKAGCSKSLSFSLLFQSMKGEYSKSELFKKYPSLYVTSYQGSLTSSSNEIKTIFERAKKIVELEKKNQIEEEKQPQFISSRT